MILLIVLFDTLYNYIKGVWKMKIELYGFLFIVGFIFIVSFLVVLTDELERWVKNREK